MNPALSGLAIGVVCLLTVTVGFVGLRLSRQTSDFYVAGRTISPRVNASAISGEYLSAASFLGVAGLVYSHGVDSLWFPVGYTLGYVVLLVLVAAPLRRSGAYTLPDFAETRLESRGIRRLCSVLVVGVGVVYLLAQLQGAGLALRQVTGLPQWIGAVLVAAVVLLNVAAGGMRSVTLAQAVQYWLKLAAICIPAFVLLGSWWGSGLSALTPPPVQWLRPGTDALSLYSTWSTLLALALGTMGLPHVVVRFYTNPDGRDARRTTVTVLGLLGLFYLFPTFYGVLGRAYLPQLPTGSSVDTMMFDLPGQVLSGGTLSGPLTAVLAGGAFAAFLSTASGLVLSVAGVIHQDLLGPLLSRAGRVSRRRRLDGSGVGGFRLSAGLAIAVPYALSWVAAPLGLAVTVNLAFTIAAATFAPLLVLGVWWRRLSVPGAWAGLLVGGVSSLTAIGVTVATGARAGWQATLLAQPAAWCVPLAVAAFILVSLLTQNRVPRGTARTLIRLHTPEAVLGDRLLDG